MAVRLDPDRGATSVMSFPRDLQVQIPGHGRTRSTPPTRSAAPSSPCRPSTPWAWTISHVVGVDFHGFGRAVNTLGCVYVDVDRRYFNDNNPPVAARTPYAAIDLKPGYQRLCGSQALDYVRFRHLDDDFVRAARQQDFLRQAKGQVGLAQGARRARRAAGDLQRYSESDLASASDATMFGLLKLGYEASKVPVRQIPFPPTVRGEGESQIVAPGALRRAIERLGACGAAARGARRRPARRPRRARAGGAARAPARRPASWPRAPRASSGRCRSRPSSRAACRSCYPRLRLARGGYATDEGVRAYPIKHTGGGSHIAYRLALWQGDDGQYYGVQGTTWRTPPILAHPTDACACAAARTRATTTDRACASSPGRPRRRVYWVSNTLSLRLSNAQMLAVARSLSGSASNVARRMSNERQPIGVIGTGYVGLVTAAGFAHLGSDVYCIDIDADKIARLKAGEIPIYEPGLADMVADNRERLHFSTDIADALDHARLLFVAVGTPPTYSGDADLSAVHAVVDAIPASDRHALVMKSTVPGGHGRGDQARARRAGQGGPELRLVPGVPQGGLGDQGLPATPTASSSATTATGRATPSSSSTRRSTRRSCAPTSPRRRWSSSPPTPSSPRRSRSSTRSPTSARRPARTSSRSRGGWAWTTASDRSSCRPASASAARAWRATRPCSCGCAGARRS